MSSCLRDTSVSGCLALSSSQPRVLQLRTLFGQVPPSVHTYKWLGRVPRPSSERHARGNSDGSKRCDVVSFHTRTHSFILYLRSTELLCCT
jgi:hypothetical protein